MLGERAASAEYTAPEHVQSAFDTGLRTLLGRGLVIRLVTWTTTFATLRFVTPADLGVLVVIQALFGLTGLVAQWGYTSYLIRRQTSPETRELAAFGSVQLAVGLAVLLAILAAPASAIEAWLGVTGAKWLLAAVAIGQVFAYGQSGSRAVLEREMNFAVLARIDVATVFALNLILLIGAVLGQFQIGIPVALVASLLIGTAMFGVHVPRAWRITRDLSSLRVGLRESSAFAAKAVADTLNRSVTTLIVSSLFGLAIVGWWSVATRFAQINLVVYESFWRAGFPAAARLANEPEMLDRLTESSFRRALRVSTPVALLVVIGAPLMAIVFPLWTPAIVAAQLWSLGYVVVGSVSSALAPRQVALKGPRILVIEAVSVFAVCVALLATLAAWPSTVAVAAAFIGGTAASIVVLAASARGPVLRDLAQDGVLEFGALIAASVGVVIGSMLGNAGLAIVVAAAALAVLVVLRRPWVSWRAFARGGPRDSAIP
jgi:O-antigen/teichoic acid export membrane protein